MLLRHRNIDTRVSERLTSKTHERDEALDTSELPRYDSSCNPGNPTTLLIPKQIEPPVPDRVPALSCHFARRAIGQSVRGRPRRLSAAYTAIEACRLASCYSPSTLRTRSTVFFAPSLSMMFLR
jgi:hypothetical protein